MTQKTKLIIRIIALIWIIAATSLITRKFNDWFPPRTEIKVVFENSVFPGVPALRPIKDKTVYLFDKCDFTGKRWGETITPAEADEALAKLDKMEGNK
jgi:hypothetical protein